MPQINLKAYSPSQVIDFIQRKKEDFWLKERERRALALFQEVANRVPAYRDFLHKHSLNPGKVKTWQDFQLVPPVSKKDYLQQYPLEMLCWDGTLARHLVFSATSGSTGEPFYFPRTEALEWESSILYEMFLKNGRNGGPVLAINCFGMGVWIGGLIAHKSIDSASRRGNLPVSIISPGVNKSEVIKALKNLSPKFGQTLLCGYPPFIKDILEEALCQGIDLKPLNMRLLFAAEAFSEAFRDYLAEMAHIKNVHLDTLNIYGSADIGTMAFETPASILIRRTAMKNAAVFQALFSSIAKTPTLAQYNPLFMTFEAPGGEILVTGNSAIPLIRHSIGDNGGVLSMSEVRLRLSSYGVDIGKEAAENGLGGLIGELPFVYVYERRDLSTSLYGLQIYPEYIRDALIDKTLAAHLTGKFTIITRYDDRQNQYLELNLESSNGVEACLLHEKTIWEIVYSRLREKSSEFRELTNNLKDKRFLEVKFWPKDHPQYFKAGAKQRWIQKPAV
ncbi:MAG: phenylacetate--CoA ligase family protein [Nitrospirae bacterium]|nr:phenylacetate--CoA ligase family protein [Nitrospirota bacterium]